ncbi:MAG TPA: arginine deiminase family protein [Vicinamibacterales bacterium]|nr:arginine deiminase family protein [Vicinamibacterales bacterium]
MTVGGESGVLTRVVLKHAGNAFRGDAAIAAEWRDLNFTSPPEYSHAVLEYDEFLFLIQSRGAEVLFLPPDDETSLDSIYVRDAAIATPRGIVLCHMGKPQRVTEPDAQERAYLAWGIPVVGRVNPPGSIEGGDVVWLDERTVAVGRGYRTNDDGIRQFRTLLGDSIDGLITVPLPHWRGAGDVFHLMSIISPVDRDLAVVYSPLMPVPFRELLIGRGMALVEVPDQEFDSMGANVLAIGPRDCVMVDGNPGTRARLEQAGATVQTYVGREISLKGGGGPTCLTRPIERQAF